MKLLFIVLILFFSKLSLNIDGLSKGFKYFLYKSEVEGKMQSKLIVKS